MNKKITIRVNGGDARERNLVLAMLQLAFRQLQVVAASQVEDQAGVMGFAADEYALSQELSKFAGQGVQIVVTDAKPEPELPGHALPALPDHIG